MEIHFAAIRIYGIYGVTIKVNTANLNVYKFQRNAEYYGEYTWEDNNESKKRSNIPNTKIRPLINIKMKIELIINRFIK